MKEFDIECVDDGGEGFFRVVIGGCVCEYEELGDLYAKLLREAGYTFIFTETEE